MRVHVVWYSIQHEAMSRGYWDEGILEAIFDRSLWRPVNPIEYVHGSLSDVPEGEGAIIVIPARWHVERADEIREALARLPWKLIVLAGDEEGSFPWKKVADSPKSWFWIQTPFPDKHIGLRGFGDGWPPACRSVLRDLGGLSKRPLAWAFAGQINNARREELREVLAGMNDGFYFPTKIFGSGLEYPEYLRTMTMARVIPAPSGTFTPDTFRLYEALEAGCVPVVDTSAPETGDVGYWGFLFGEVPFPVVERWDELPAIVKEVERDWPAPANRCSSWWQQRKRDMAYAMDDDVKELMPHAPARDSSAGLHVATGLVADRVTILIPTSPVPGNPDTAHLEQTLASVRAYPALADAEVLIMCDGVRPEQAHLKRAYDEYLRRLLWKSNFEWHNVLPIVHDEHLHQAEMTRRALELVRTEAVLFVEHDTPLTGEIPWEQLVQAVAGDEVNVIRLYHETVIQRAHRHMMLEPRPREVDGVPLIPTVQWSQRPHLAKKSFYRWMIVTYFGRQARTMIEDTMHGVVHNEYREHKVQGWYPFRLHIYAPEGNTQRSIHLDARGDEPVLPMKWAYDGEVPFGAPNPR